MKEKSFKKLFVSLLCLGFSLLSVSCTMFYTGDPPTSPWPQNIQVYFTEPGISPGTAVDRMLPERVANFIRSAKRTIDVNIYELSEPVIYEAIVEMHKKGLAVRMVGDGNSVDYPGYQALIRAGVPMDVSPSTHIMHNKFVIVDGERLTVGSMNYTPSSRKNNENLVFINHAGIAAYYTKEMDEMFTGARGTHKKKWEGIGENEFDIDNGDGSYTKIEVYFSPHVGAVPKAANTKVRQIQLIDAVPPGGSIHFAIFAFTDRDTALALENAKERGVHVVGVFDAGWHESNAYSMHQRLTDNGLDVRMDGNNNLDPKNPYHGAKIHSKIMVFDADGDNPVVQTGSLNFSPAAATDGNDENAVFIHNRAVAQRYRDEIMKMYHQGWHLTQSHGGSAAIKYEVVIDEINWAGSKTDDEIDNEDDKFIALRNRSDREINISGWLLWGPKQSSYRIFGYVFPPRTVIPPGGYHIVGYAKETSAFSWDATANVSWSSFPYIKGMPSTPFNGGSPPVIDPTPFALPNILYLRLRDVNQNTIDEAGRINASLGSRGRQYASIKRVGENGLDPDNWVTTSGHNGAVRTEYTTYTSAYPGSAYSYDPDDPNKNSEF